MYKLQIFLTKLKALIDSILEVITNYKNKVKEIFKKETSIGLKKFANFETNMISFKDLQTIPVEKPQTLECNDKSCIEFTRLKSDNQNLSFRVIMQKGQTWEKHYHDIDENILVYKGELKDLISNFTCVAGQLWIIKKNKIHYITAVKDSIFYVEFKNPKNES